MSERIKITIEVTKVEDGHEIYVQAAEVQGDWSDYYDEHFVRRGNIGDLDEAISTKVMSLIAMWENKGKVSPKPWTWVLARKSLASGVSIGNMVDLNGDIVLKDVSENDAEYILALIRQEEKYEK